MNIIARILADKNHATVFSSSLNLSDSEKAWFMSEKMGHVSFNTNSNSLTIEYEDIIQFHLTLLKYLPEISEQKKVEWALLRHEETRITIETNTNKEVEIKFIYFDKITQRLLCNFDDFLTALLKHLYDFILFIKTLYDTDLNHLKKQLDFLNKHH